MIDPVELKKLIDSHATRAKEIADQRAYVEGRNPGILEPYPKEEPDARIPVAFVRRAVNLILGYMFKEGNISYLGTGYDDKLQAVFDANDEGILDMELARTALAHGTAFELHWTDGGQDQFAQVPIEQCVPIYDDSIRPTMTGFVRTWEKDRKVYADVYDAKEIQRYVKPQGGAAFAVEGAAVAHGYGRVPVVEFYIAPDKSNTFDHVRALIDFYDKIISEDYANELARFAASYLLMAGKLSSEVDSETGESEIDKIKQTRTFENLGDSRAVTDAVAFLTKTLPVEFTDAAADRTELLIYEMLQLFNPNDESFATASGVAQKYKLLGFEYLCAQIATYFSIGLQDRIALIKGLAVNLSAKIGNAIRAWFGGRKVNTDVTIDFKRNLPDDLFQLSQIAANLKGTLSDETILRLFPSYVVEDVDEELARLSAAAPDIFDETGQGEPTADAAGVPAVSGQVQATALNGAQVTALQGIAQSVADGLLPYATAIEVVLIAFPTIDRSEAERMLKPADGFTPAKAAAATVPAGLIPAVKPEGAE